MFKERDCVKEHAETELCIPDYCAQLHKLLSIIATWIKIPDCGSSPWWHFWKDWQSEFVKAKKRGTNEFICVFFFFFVARVFSFFSRSTVTHTLHCQIHKPQVCEAFSPLIPAIFFSCFFLLSEISSTLLVLSEPLLQSSYSPPPPQLCVPLSGFLIKRQPPRLPASLLHGKNHKWETEAMQLFLPGWLTCKECGGSAQELLISLFLGSTDYPQDLNTAPLLQTLTVFPCLMRVWARPSESRRLCCTSVQEKLRLWNNFWILFNDER